MNYAQIRKNVLKKIKPSQEENKRLQEHIAIFTSELEAALGFTHTNAKVFVGGSFAKGTWLKKNYDVDVFVRFAKNEKDISDKLETALDVLPDRVERVHGSRDYFQLQRGTFIFEIVPVLNISNSNDAKNVTDMSPLHVTHITKYLTSKLRDDVRLAKQFAKAQRVYGAESYINGFSGHILELLIVEYGGFLPLLKAVASWQKQVVLDPKKHHKNPLQKLNAAKITSPLIIVDPVQPERNAAAALCAKSFALFIHAAKTFTTKPSLSAFTQKKITPEVIRKKFSDKSCTVVFELVALKGKRDVVGTKCLKAFEFMQKHLVGFTLVTADFFYDHDIGRALAYIAVNEDKLPKTFLQQGPPSHAKKDSLNFRKKHGALRHKILEHNNRLFAQVPYENRTVLKQVKQLVKENSVASRVKSVKFY